MSALADWPLDCCGILTETLLRGVSHLKHAHIHPDCPLYNNVRWSIPACTVHLSHVGEHQSGNGAASAANERAWRHHFSSDHSELLLGMAAVLEATTAQLQFPCSEHSGTSCPLHCAQLIPSSIDSFPLTAQGGFSMRNVRAHVCLLDDGAFPETVTSKDGDALQD